MDNALPLSRKAVALGILAGGGLAAAVAARADADQPHMQAALSDLQAARAQLNQAEHDKAGHRESALDLVNQAIAQVRSGIRAGNM